MSQPNAVLQDLEPAPPARAITYYTPGPKPALGWEAPTLAALMKTDASVTIIPTKRKSGGAQGSNLSYTRKTRSKKAKLVSKVKTLAFQQSLFTYLLDFTHHSSSASRSIL